jgi:hypothetical protein
LIIGEDLRNAEGNFNERIESQANREKDFMKKKTKAFAFNINQEMKPSDQNKRKSFPKILGG